MCLVYFSNRKRYPNIRCRCGLDTVYSLIHYFKSAIVCLHCSFFCFVIQWFKNTLILLKWFIVSKICSFPFTSTYLYFNHIHYFVNHNSDVPYVTLTCVCYLYIAYEVSGPCVKQYKRFIHIDVCIDMSVEAFMFPLTFNIHVIWLSC